MIFHWDLHALIHPSGGEVGLQPSQHQRDDRKMSTEGMTCLDDVSDHFSMVMLKIHRFPYGDGPGLLVDLKLQPIPCRAPGIPSLGYGRSHNFWPPFFSTWDFLIYVPQKNMCTMDPKWIFFFLGPSFWHLAFGVTSTEALDDWPFCHSALQIFRNHTHEATAVWHLEVKRSRVWAAGKKWLIYCQNYTRMTARRPNRKRNSSKRGDTPKKNMCHEASLFLVDVFLVVGGRPV